MGWGHRTTLKESIYWKGGHRTTFTKKSLAVGGWVGCGAFELDGSIAEPMNWVGGGPSQRITPLCGSILQAGTCQILSLTECAIWSRVWQQEDI